MQASRYFAGKAFGASILAVALASVISAPASAQADTDGVPEADEAIPQRDQIIVTAQFREQSLQDTPLAITAITGDTLEARGQTDVSQIAAQAPNVTLEPGVGSRGAGLTAFIRGVGQYNGSPALEPGVGTYVDDIYIATLQSSLFNLLDLERVEVLRGPQGTLAGKNSIGGAIKLFSRKPSGDGSGYVRALYGSFDRMEVQTAADFPLSDNLFVRVNGTGRTEHGYVTRIDYACANPGSGLPQGNSNDDCELGTSGGRRYVGGRVAMRWLANDRIEVNVAADYTDEFSEPDPATLRVVDPAILASVGNDLSAVNGQNLTSAFATSGSFINYATYCNPNALGGTAPVCLDPASATDTWGVSGTIDFELSDRLALRSITGYRGYSTYSAVDGDLGPFAQTINAIGYHGTQFSQELRLTANPIDPLELTVGVFYLDAYINSDSRVDLQYQNNVFVNDDDTDIASKAVYGQAILDVTDRLHLTGGIRYTKENKDYQFFRTLPDGNQTPIPGLYGLLGSFSGSRVDYRGNISFDIASDAMVYAQYATGFKGGGINGQPFFADQVYSFGPETMETYEIGGKLGLFDSRVTLNLAGFYSNYEDIQLQAQFCPAPSTPFPCAGPQNVGSAHVKGIEAELFAEPVEDLTIDASFAYVDFDYYELLNTPNITLDMVSPFTPEYSGSAGIQYTADMGTSGSITPRVDLNYRSSLFTDPSSSELNRLEGRTIVNARLGWMNEDEDLEIALEVSNLFDKFYIQNSIEQSRFTGLAYDYPGAPRRWAVSVRKEF